MNFLLSKTFLCVFLLSPVLWCSAEYLWPVDEKKIYSLHSEFDGVHVYLLIESEGEIHSSISGKVFYIRDNDNINPGIVQIYNHEGIMITFMHIIPKVNIGDEINAGDIVGENNDHNVIYLSVYDKLKDKYVDPLLILPEINRRVSIKLEDMKFKFTTETENQEVQLSNRIKSGISDVEMRISVRDIKSKGYILPYTVWLNIGKKEYIISRNKSYISEENPFSMSVIEEGKLFLIVSNVDIPIGYQNIYIKIKTPFRGIRNLKFNVYAAYSE